MQQLSNIRSTIIWFFFTLDIKIQDSNQISLSTLSSFLLSPFTPAPDINARPRHLCFPTWPRRRTRRQPQRPHLKSVGCASSSRSYSYPVELPFRHRHPPGFGGAQPPLSTVTLTQWMSSGYIHHTLPFSYPTAFPTVRLTKPPPPRPCPPSSPGRPSPPYLSL